MCRSDSPAEQQKLSGDDGWDKVTARQNFPERKVGRAGKRELQYRRRPEGGSERPPSSTAVARTIYTGATSNKIAVFDFYLTILLFPSQSVSWSIYLSIVYGCNNKKYDRNIVILTSVYFAHTHILDHWMDR